MNTLRSIWNSKFGTIIRSAGMVAILGAIASLITYFGGIENQAIWIPIFVVVLKAIQKWLSK